MTTTKPSNLKGQLAYWVPTALVVLCMALGGVCDALLTDQAHEAMQHLGYPDYFTVILGVAKLLGVVALLAPVPRFLREWAYAGFCFDTIGAAVSIVAAGGSLPGAATPLFMLALILLSRRAWLVRSGARATHADVRGDVALAA